MDDAKAIAAATAIVVRETVAAALEPILARLAVLEARQLERGEKGERGDPGEKGERGEAGERGERGEDGASVDLAWLTDTVQSMVSEAVEAAVKALPAPERGERGETGQTGEQGERGADGVGLADAVIDRAGELVLTMTDGGMRRLGVVVGRDGENGRDGEDGRDGRDVEDIVVTQDGATVEFGFTVGEARSVFEIELPVGPPGETPYVGEARGLFDPEATYRALDVVSFNGCEWRARCDNPGTLPGEGWMLSAGRGKRGEKGERGDRGGVGLPGPSLVTGYVKDMALTLVREDGQETQVDLYDFAETIRRVAAP